MLNTSIECYIIWYSFLFNPLILLWVSPHSWTLLFDSPSVPFNNSCPYLGSSSRLSNTPIVITQHWSITEAYDALYYEDSDEEHTPEQDNNLAYEDTDEDQSGFRKPLQRETFSSLHISPDVSHQGGLSRLGGSEDSTATESSSLGSGDNTGMATTFRNRREKTYLLEAGNESICQKWSRINFNKECFYYF